MKQFLKCLLPALLCFTACMNVNEDIEINENGSGGYSEEIDLSSMFAFISAAASMDSSNSSSSSTDFPDMDTTFSLKGYADTATGLTPEEKRLTQNASVNIISNKANNIFKLKLIFPFSSIDDLGKLSAMTSGMNSLNMAMKSSGMDKTMPQEGDDKDMPDLASIYTFTCSKGVIDKKVDEEKWKDLQQNEQILQLQQSGEMMKSYIYTTNIHLPSPVKKLTGEKAALSADKKTVIIQGSMADMAVRPETFAYHIEY